jgi:dTDP-glucose pyrophosphorylase
MKNLVLSEASSFKDAIELLDNNGNGFLAITNKLGQLLGILTDGDVRRAVLDGKTELSTIMNTKPMTMNEGQSREKVILKLKKLHRKHMPIVDDNMFLKDIVILDEEGFNLKPNWVVIMAGGLGTRLGKLTKDTPKPMLEAGSKPMLEHIIDMFVSHGFTKFMLSVNYKSEIIKEYFNDGSGFGIEVKYLEEKKRLGTGGGLGLIDIELNDPFFVTNGDVFSSLDYIELLEYHKEQNAAATMCIRKDIYQIPYGVIEVDDKNNIVTMEEKPVKEFFINSGIYILDPKVLSYIPKDEFFDLPSLFDILKNSGEKTKSFKIIDYWIDIGSPSDYKAIIKKLSK